MNEKVKHLWVSALRSGNFKKGKYQLRDLDECYDATGVLCQLAVSAGVVPAPTKQDDPEKHQFFGYVYVDPNNSVRCAAVLPGAVSEWSGVSHRLGYRVAMMGDKGVSFDKIADYIEENL